MLRAAVAGSCMTNRVWVSCVRVSITSVCASSCSLLINRSWLSTCEGEEGSKIYRMFNVLHADSSAVHLNESKGQRLPMKRAHACTNVCRGSSYFTVLIALSSRQKGSVENALGSQATHVSLFADIATTAVLFPSSVRVLCVCAFSSYWGLRRG